MNKQAIQQRLQEIQAKLTDYVQAQSQADFEHQVGESWSAKGYLAHLILSVKPFVKGFSLPQERLVSLFGETDTSPVSYDEIVARYQARLDEGMRAEDYDKVTPDFYRFPEGTEDEQAHLLAAWNETHEKLYTTLETWDEDALDRVLLPHPAIGKITMREMLYFTIYHNNLHSQDIKNLHIKQRN